MGKRTRTGAPTKWTSSVEPGRVLFADFRDAPELLGDQPE